MKKITDPTFRYVPSYETDLRKRFKRMDQEKKAKEKAEALPETVARLPLPARKKP